ncbi:unnamed protein product [Meganyctiphanes norvegica]|uniref:Actin maturation protease n=1 Tax=Meganyctiphanes norvegica TaxID=48144 RepID=A0AAV2PV31_MEGNR
MLVPINHPLAVSSARSTPARQLSPPPAPLRSSSIRKTSPPPPPSRSRSHTPVGRLEWTEQRPPLPPPPPISACTSTTPTPLKLTPVPEESSRSPSVHSQSPQSTDENITENAVYEQTSKDSTFESTFSCGSLGKVSDIVISKSSDNISSAEPPRVPPPPSDEIYDELCPTLPPPPSDITPEEKTPPPPPLPSDISSISIQSLPTPPPRANIVTPALPPPPSLPLNFSPLSPQLTPPELPPPPVDIESPNNTNNFISAESEPGNSETSVMPSEPPPPTLQANETANISIKVEGIPPVPKPPQAPGHPPPPPPPPMSATGSLTESSSPTSLISISPSGRMVVNRTDLPPPAPEEEIRKVFQNAKNWAWLDPTSDTLAVYTQLRPTIQQGPQCGMVALSMATQIFSETMDVDPIVKIAKDRGFTAHGEMFSSEKMAELANEISGIEATVRRDVLSNPKMLLETLLQGDLILVPYDADGNHQPSQRKGHRAHWGIVCGALVQCPSLKVSMGGSSKQDPTVDHLYHLRPKNRAGLPVSAKRGGGGTTPVHSVSPRFSASPLDVWGTPDVELWSMCSSRISTPQLQSLPNDDYTMVVLWRQGKSRSLIASTLDALFASNDQLEEYSPPANEREQEYVIESVEDGLAHQVVVLHKTKYALSDLLGVLQEKE